MDNLRGSLLMVLAMFLFSVEDALIKRLADTLALGQIVIVLGAGGAVVIAAWCLWRSAPFVSWDVIHPTMILRNLAELCGTFGFVTAVALIPLSTASAILQAVPLVVTLGAALFLSETVGWRRWSAIVVGLVGVLLIIRPGTDAFDPLSLFAVMGVLGLAARDIATRRIPTGLSTAQVSFAAFVTSILTGVLLLQAGIAGDVMINPSMPDNLRLLATTLIGIAAYGAIVAATRTGDVAVVAPFRYSRLVFALAIGALVFGERPDALTLTGAGIVILSGLYTLWRETRLNRHKAAL